MGWMGWDWIGSPGGRGYRAPYGANNGNIRQFQMSTFSVDVLFVIISLLKLSFTAISLAKYKTIQEKTYDQCCCIFGSLIKYLKPMGLEHI